MSKLDFEVEKTEDHFLVKEKILSAEEMKTIISNHELLKIH
ncbi:hypothetical protein [Rickettsia tamurae]|nr:hypothetical protein [Rickettsia tamurae]